VRPRAAWPVRLPMVKAAVRAMDAIQEFIPTLNLPEVPRVERFVIAGGSKRGWSVSHV
jgi:PhoPQ-activated pathogenicity-related protein